MSTGTVLILAGLAGLAISLIAIPIAVIVLRKKGQRSAESIRSEYEL